MLAAQALLRSAVYFALKLVFCKDETIANFLRARLGVSVVSLRGRRLGRAPAVLAVLVPLCPTGTFALKLMF